MTNTEWKEYTRDRLTDLGFDADSIFARYAEEHRFYHTLDHVFYILKRMEADVVIEQNVYFLATVFHDYYYDPTADIGYNEIKSEELFRTLSKNTELSPEIIDKVSTVILESDIRQKTTIGESELFRVYDLGILEEKFSKLMDYELKIFKEYQHVDWKVYQEKRIEFLKSISKKEYPVVEQLLEYVKAWKPNIGLYVGSFNPFHKGHLDILKKAEAIFDKVIVAAGVNVEKTTQPSTSFPPDKLRFRQTVKFNNLLSDFIDDLGYDVTIVVGIRNQRDLEENMNAFYFHQDLKANTKMVALFSDRNLRHVSSTNIRILHEFEKAPKYDI